MPDSKKIITSFLFDIQEAKKFDREHALLEYITSRLDTALDNYIETLDKDAEYLKFRNNLKLAKRLNK